MAGVALGAAVPNVVASLKRNNKKRSKRRPCKPLDEDTVYQSPKEAGFGEEVLPHPDV